MCQNSVSNPNRLYKGHDVVDGLLPVYRSQLWLHISKCANHGIGIELNFAVSN